MTGPFEPGSEAKGAVWLFLCALAVVLFVGVWLVDLAVRSAL